MDFENWLTENSSYIQEQQVSLAQKLPSSPAELEDVLSETESHYGRFTELLAEATTHIFKAEFAEIQKTSVDEKIDIRRARVKANTTAQREVADKIKGIVYAISQRVMYGMALMKSNVKEHNTIANREKVE